MKKKLWKLMFTLPFMIGIGTSIAACNTNANSKLEINDAFYLKYMKISLDALIPTLNNQVQTAILQNKFSILINLKPYIDSANSNASEVAKDYGQSSKYNFKQMQKITYQITSNNQCISGKMIAKITNPYLEFNLQNLPIFTAKENINLAIKLKLNSSADALDGKIKAIYFKSLEKFEVGDRLRTNSALESVASSSDVVSNTDKRPKTIIATTNSYQDLGLHPDVLIERWDSTAKRYQYSSSEATNFQAIKDIIEIDNNTFILAGQPANTSLNSGLTKVTFDQNNKPVYTELSIQNPQHTSTYHINQIEVISDGAESIAKIVAATNEGIHVFTKATGDNYTEQVAEQNTDFMTIALNSANTTGYAVSKKKIYKIANIKTNPAPSTMTITGTFNTKSTSNNYSVSLVNDTTLLIGQTASNVFDPKLYKEGGFWYGEINNNTINVTAIKLQIPKYYQIGFIDVLKVMIRKVQNKNYVYILTRTPTFLGKKVMLNLWQGEWDSSQKTMTFNRYNVGYTYSAKNFENEFYVTKTFNNTSYNLVLAYNRSAIPITRPEGAQILVTNIND